MLESFVVLPLQKYENLQELAHKPSEDVDTHSSASQPPADKEAQPVEKSPPPEAAESIPESAHDSDSSSSLHDLSTHISDKTKQMVRDKKINETYFMKCLKVLEENGIGHLHLENLQDLVRNSISQSRKKLPNEEAFYSFIIQHGLM